MKLFNAFSGLLALAMAFPAVNAGCSPECPEENPGVAGNCVFCPNLKCEYGEETCCGKTHPSMIVSCDIGELRAFSTDACFHPVCDSSSNGDPHFNTWSGEKYDYHGECDLVLLKNEDFSDGLGMRVHIRTSIRNDWSFIESAALQIGENTLEVMGGKNSASYWINGGEKTDLQTSNASLGDFAVKFKRINDHQSLNRIDLGNGDAISIETFKDFVRVNFKNKHTAFKGSSGLMGDFESGKKIGRDGKQVFEDSNAFGQEWQVLATEGSLFHTIEGAVQPPNKCIMPDPTLKSSEKRRRLGEAALISEEDAAIACARVAEAERDACIFDVIATNDKDMAGSY